MLGTLLKCKDEKIFVFNLINAEAYISISAPSEDVPEGFVKITLPQVHSKKQIGNNVGSNENTKEETKDDTV